ncbi:hypothetical protein AYI68_g7905 [Smittium mucronatum]|uniref:Uncharacterized protein n=1 Tax=Smittium mucronatum TaxID=133383 RepID=A0A1R0GMF3_9FUNG|nr:hypothetical protein AYI68_g7905 [Smittium mucronatum]
MYSSSMLLVVLPKEVSNFAFTKNKSFETTKSPKMFSTALNTVAGVKMIDNIKLQTRDAVRKLHFELAVKISTFIISSGFKKVFLHLKMM